MRMISVKKSVFHVFSLFYQGLKPIYPRFGEAHISQIWWSSYILCEAHFSQNKARFVEAHISQICWSSFLPNSVSEQIEQIVVQNIRQLILTFRSNHGLKKISNILILAGFDVAFKNDKMLPANGHLMRLCTATETIFYGKIRVNSILSPPKERLQHKPLRDLQ